MIASIRGVFEGHLTVADLERSMRFYGEALGLSLAHQVPERRAAFYWVGGEGLGLLGLWEITAPQRLAVHIAFTTELADLLQAAPRLREAGITPLDFDGRATEAPVVLAWMPAASLYFRDPDGHLLELISMLPDPPASDLGVVGWSEWSARHR